MRFFQSSTVQVEDAWLTNTPFTKKNGVPDTVLEQPYFQDILLCSSNSLLVSPSLMTEFSMLSLLPKSAIMLHNRKKRLVGETST